MMISNGDRIVVPRAGARRIGWLFSIVYMALAAVFAISKPNEGDSVLSDGGVRLWTSFGMATLMLIAASYLAVLAIASLSRMEFPAPNIPVFARTLIRQGRSAIMPAVVCLAAAAGLAVMPAVYFWALS